LKPLLKFSPGNAKLQNRGIAVFSLPAGYTCPGADACLARFDRMLGKVIDGPNQKFRCYAASMEGQYPSLRRATDHNWDLLKKAKTREGMAELIATSLPGFYFDKIRIHQDGDFWSADYMGAWIDVAVRMPERLFYAYTKSIPIWLRLEDQMPANFVLNASLDGKHDRLVMEKGLRYSKVVFHPEEAQKLGLPVDHDDSLAMNPMVGEFALLLHGVQPADSVASAAIRRMKLEGITFSYPRKK